MHFLRRRVAPTLAIPLFLMTRLVSMELILQRERLYLRVQTLEKAILFSQILFFAMVILNLPVRFLVMVIFFLKMPSSGTGSRIFRILSMVMVRSVLPTQNSIVANFCSSIRSSEMVNSVLK